MDLRNMNNISEYDSTIQSNIQGPAESKAEVNQAMNDGCTPLYIAALNGHLEVAQLLIPFNIHCRLN